MVRETRQTEWPPARYRLPSLAALEELSQLGGVRRQTSLLGIPRSTIRDWCRPIIKNGQSANTNKPGRPSKISPEQKDTILARLKAGETQKEVAESLGVNQATVSRKAKLRRLTEIKGVVRGDKVAPCPLSQVL